MFASIHAVIGRDNKDIKGVGSSAMAKLLEYSWPGNIRELENAIEHSFVICSSGQIKLKHLPIEIKTPFDNKSSYHSSDEYAYSKSYPGASDKKLTKEELIDLLEECSWNKAEVGRRINKSRTSVWKYMKKWGIPLQKQ